MSKEKSEIIFFNRVLLYILFVNVSFNISIIFVVENMKIRRCGMLANKTTFYKKLFYPGLNVVVIINIKKIKHDY